MNVIKRDGSVVPFDKQKIVDAIMKANSEVDHDEQIELRMANKIADAIDSYCQALDGVSVEDIQDMVEKLLMDGCYYDLQLSFDDIGNFVLTPIKGHIYVEWDVTE